MGNVSGNTFPVDSSGLFFSHASIFAQKYSVSESDIYFLYERFQQLKPDTNGFIDKNVFNIDEYSNPFCKQVWSRLSEDNLDPNIIDFESLVKTAAWWQGASVPVKLKLLFSWMVDNGAISAEILAKVLGHILQNYTKDEISSLSIEIVNIMSSQSGSDDVNQEDFLSWFMTASQYELNHSLHFSIQDLDFADL